MLFRVVGNRLVFMGKSLLIDCNVISELRLAFEQVCSYMV